MTALRASARRQRGLDPLWMVGPARAASGPYPYREHRTVAEVLADEAMLHPVMPEVRDWIAEVEAGLNEDSEPQAKAGDVRAAVVKGGGEPVSRAVGGRSPTATSEMMDATAGETAPVSLPARRTNARTVAGDVRPPATEILPVSDGLATALQRVHAGECARCTIVGWQYGHGCIEVPCPLKGYA